MIDLGDTKGTVNPASHGLYEGDNTDNSRAMMTPDVKVIEAAIKSYLSDYPLEDINVTRRKNEVGVDQLEIQVVVNDATGKRMAFGLRLMGIFTAQSMGIFELEKQNHHDQD